ncbi:MAG: polyprenyl synthetase family protein [Chthonomonadales bacterium]|nr:polyprenyl synthetase family protein [Chthonomonadales bacterium]
MTQPLQAVPSNGSNTGFLDVVRSELQSVEHALKAAVASEVHAVDAVAQHVLLAGGKRLRPATVVLTARALGLQGDSERMVAVAAAMEIVHTATLVHDDVVDNTSVRRGAATANAVFGNGVAVISGDFLLARAVSMLAQESETRLIRTVADVTVDMSEGEVQELITTGEPKLTEAAYFALIHKKTASFIEGCCRCGAIVAGADSDLERAVATYGLNVGMAFQLADDLLDYVGDPAVTGKPIGTDLREGRATLPFLYGLQRASNGHRERLLAAFASPALREASIAAVVRTLDNLGAFDHAREVARAHAETAKQALRGLERTVYRDALELLADYAAERDR